MPAPHFAQIFYFLRGDVFAAEVDAVGFDGQRYVGAGVD